MPPARARSRTRGARLLYPDPMDEASSSTAGRVKGAVLLSRLAFVNDELGEQRVAEILAGLPEEDRRVMGGIVLAFAWYPFEINARFDAAIAGAMGIGERVFLALGARSASDNLANAHKSFVKERDPHGLLKHAASIYKLYYDTGHRTYERIGTGKAVLRTLESGTFSRADCLTVVGWHERAIQMCGGLNVHVTETHCRVHGAPMCEYVCEWD